MTRATWDRQRLKAESADHPNAGRLACGPIFLVSMVSFGSELLGWCFQWIEGILDQLAIDQVVRYRNPLRFRSGKQWRSWLAKNHLKEREAFLVIYKRAPKNVKFPSRAALEEALCYGWIDGWFKPLDDEKWVIRYTPRRRGSNWSKYNIATAWNLLNEQRMTPAGMAKLPSDALEVWEKYKPKATVIVGMTQGRGITFSDGTNYLSKIKMPSKAP